MRLSPLAETTQYFPQQPQHLQDAAPPTPAHCHSQSSASRVGENAGLLQHLLAKKVPATFTHVPHHPHSMMRLSLSVLTYTLPTLSAVLIWVCFCEQLTRLDTPGSHPPHTLAPRPVLFSFALTRSPSPCHCPCPALSCLRSPSVLTLFTLPHHCSQSLIHLPSIMASACWQGCRPVVFSVCMYPHTSVWKGTLRQICWMWSPLLKGHVTISETV